MLPRRMISPRHWTGFALFLLLASALAVPAAGAEVTLSINVPAARMKSLRLRNLAEGTVVGVAVQADGEISVAFVGGKELKESPRGVPPLFTGRLERRLTFSVTIPSTGHYYVVLDNRKGEESRAVRVRVRAVRKSPPDLTKEKSRTL